MLNNEHRTDKPESDTPSDDDRTAIMHLAQKALDTGYHVLILTPTPNEHPQKLIVIAPDVSAGVNLKVQTGTAE